MAEVRTGTHTAGWVGDPPRHIAIIMDGNGRWATKRGLPRTAGHKAGAETFRKIATYCKNIGVKYLTVYAFSTENWKALRNGGLHHYGAFEKVSAGGGGYHGA